MYELVRLGEKTYYIDCPSRIGIYTLNEKDVCLIDSGNGPDAGKKVLGVCEKMRWTVKYIINTHAHADHTGGNALIQKRTGCKILCAAPDLALVNYPMLNNSLTFGGKPMKEICNKFMLAEASTAMELTEESIPKGLYFKHFDGHSLSQTAIFCDDGTCFTGDILCGSSTIEKYHIFFIYDTQRYLEAIRALLNEDAQVFCASHYPPVRDKSELCDLVALNESKIGELLSAIKEICIGGKAFEDVLALLLSRYGLELSENQYAIAGCTVKGFLSYLHDKGELELAISENHLVWSCIDRS